MNKTIEPTAQVLDLFGRHDPLLGRTLCMDQACGCGSNVKWLSHEDYRICGTVLAEITGRSQ
jgi:hypothetical protein